MKTVKPQVKLAGTDGNIAGVVASAAQALRKAGLDNKVAEMKARVRGSRSYHEALTAVVDYVEFV